MKQTEEQFCDSLCPCDDPCPMSLAIRLIGGRWKLRLLCSLYVDGTQRYSDLLKKVKNITPAMLSASLKELEADDIVARRQYQEMPVRVEYSLTAHGRELWPIMHQLIHWARHEPYEGEPDAAGYILGTQAEAGNGE